MVKKWKYYSSSTFETNSNKLSQMLGENSLELLQGRWIKGSQNHQQCPASVQRRSHAALGTALLAISQNAFLQHPATQCWFVEKLLPSFQISPLFNCLSKWVKNKWCCSQTNRLLGFPDSYIFYGLIDISE